MAAFVLWEIYAPIKEPLVPMHLFRNIEWVSAVILLSLGAGVYYAFAIICMYLYLLFASTGPLS